MGIGSGGMEVSDFHMDFGLVTWRCVSYGLGQLPRVYW